MSGLRRGGRRPLKVSVGSGSVRRETKRSWRRGVFVAGWREGSLRLFGRICRTESVWIVKLNGQFSVNPL